VPIIRKLRIHRDATTWKIQGELRREDKAGEGPCIGIYIVPLKKAANWSGYNFQMGLRWSFARNIEVLLVFFTYSLSQSTRTAFLLNTYHLPSGVTESVKDNWFSFHSINRFFRLKLIHYLSINVHKYSNYNFWEETLSIMVNIDDNFLSTKNCEDNQGRKRKS
jgi:hypothetical protein